jgi:transposase InsO family protein
LRDLAFSRPRYGYRRLCILLRREVWQVNHKRVLRIYREEGLAVRSKKKEKTRCPASCGAACGYKNQRALEYEFCI